MGDGIPVAASGEPWSVFFPRDCIPISLETGFEGDVGRLELWILDLSSRKFDEARMKFFRCDTLTRFQEWSKI